MESSARSIAAFNPVPWKTRDVWLGLASAIALTVVATAAWFFLAPEPFASDIAPVATFGTPLVIPVVWLFGPRKYGVRWDTLGLRAAARNSFGLSCGTLAAVYILAAWNLACLLLLRIPIEPAATVAVASTRWPAWLLAAGVVAAPISEELLFRGFAFAGLQARYGWKRAALLTSLVFAVAHLQPAAIVVLFGAGFLLSMLYYRTNSLWPGVIVHAAINGIGLVAAIYLPSETGLS